MRAFVYLVVSMDEKMVGMGLAEKDQNWLKSEEAA
jgi:hypothetical protein